MSAFTFGEAGVSGGWEGLGDRRASWRGSEAPGALAEAGLSGSRGDRTFNDSIIQLVGTGSHPGFVVSSSTRPR